MRLLFKASIVWLIFSINVLCASVAKWDLNGITDITIFDGNLMFVNRSGDVFMASDEGNFTKMEFPDRIIQLVSNRNTLYLLREDGSVWQYNIDGLKVISEDLPVRQIIYYGNRLYMLKNIGILTCLENGRPRILLSGHQYTTMTRAGNKIFLTDGWGRIYRYDTYVDFLEMIDTVGDTVQIVGGDNTLFALKKNGTVYKYEFGRFQPLKYAKKIKTMATNGKYLYFANIENEIFELNLAIARMHKIEITTDVDFLRAFDDRLFISGKDGSFFEYSPHPKRHSIQMNFYKIYAPFIDVFDEGFLNTAN